MIDMQCVIPYKTGLKTPHRERNLFRCTERLKELHIRYIISESNPNEPFNRSVLLNRGISLVTSDIFCCLDADMFVPDKFDFLIDDVLSHYDAFFPICMNKEQDGTFKWRHSGLGIVAFRKSVWQKFNLTWNENRIKWGGEDNDLYDSCLSKEMKIARFWCLGLIHMWHPTDTDYKNANT